MGVRKKTKHKKILKKHDRLCEKVASHYAKRGHEVKLHHEYNNGEMDVLVDNYLYIECKCNYNKKTYQKGVKQIKKAIKKNVCLEGYIQTYDGIYEVT